MAIEIVPHGEAWKPAVEAFNARMRRGGSEYGFYVHPVPTWLAKRHDGQKAWREFWLAVEDGAHVRGAYVLKPQEWWIGGTVRTVTDWQGPYSEGAVAREHGGLGVRLLLDMQRRRPLLYSWGHGGEGSTLSRVLRALGWTLHPTPLLCRVLRPFRFARRAAALRRSTAARLALDAAAFSGVAALGTRALDALSRLRSPLGLSATAEVVPCFGPWTDRTWHRARNDYAALAVRDAAAMNELVPTLHEHREWSEPVRLRARDRGGRDLGWAVVTARQMDGDRRFGSLLVGTIVDAFAEARHAAEVVHAATGWLARRGADLVIANQSDPRWIAAFGRNAFVRAPFPRSFCAAPALMDALRPWERTRERLFLTNMDGHGPMGL
jgi:hypothetical protein